jgi:hypothetical protein
MGPKRKASEASGAGCGGGGKLSASAMVNARRGPVKLAKFLLMHPLKYTACTNGRWSTDDFDVDKLHANEKRRMCTVEFADSLVLVDFNDLEDDLVIESASLDSLFAKWGCSKQLTLKRESDAEIDFEVDLVREVRKVDEELFDGRDGLARTATLSGDVLHKWEVRHGKLTPGSEFEVCGQYIRVEFKFIGGDQYEVTCIALSSSLMRK